MRFALGILSLVAFVVLIGIVLIFVSNPPDEPLLPVLGLVVAGGLTVVFRALRARV